MLLLTPLQQWLLFIGVSFAVGCVAWRVVVAPGAMRLLSGARAAAVEEIERRVARAGMITGLVLFVAWVLRMVDQVRLFRDEFVPLSEDVGFLLFETFWGTVWMAQGVIVLLLTIAFRSASARHGVSGGPEIGPPETNSRRMSRPWMAAALLVVPLVASLALSSHAMSVDAWKPLIVTSDAVHVLAAGAWIGGLGLILTIGRPTSAGEYDRELFAAQIRGFSPMAMVSVTALLSMGIVLSWTHLTTVSDLWTMSYGRILSAKIFLAAGVLAVGFVNWRRGIPALETETGSRATWRRASLEVWLAMGVLLLTALLVHSVKP